MKKHRSWPWLLVLLLATLSLQSCLGIGDNGQFQSKGTGQNGKQININTSDQAVFNGKIYFTTGHNLYVLDGKKSLKQLTNNMDVRDPAVSPDGSKIAFIRRDKDYSDLMLMNADGSNVHTLRSGNGKFVPNPYSDFPKSTYYWYAQPAWSTDSKNLLFLSDIGKFIYDPGVDNFLLDLQIYTISIDNPAVAKPQVVAYTNYGDGGLRDPSYRPHHSDQVIYTSYRYDKSQTKQVIQILTEDPNAIVKHPYKYRPGAASIEVDPGVALTPELVDQANMQPVFSPDGNTIMYVRRENATTRSIYLMPATDGVTGDPNNPKFDPNTDANLKKGLDNYNQSSKLLSKPLLTLPIWSPNGTQIAFIDNNNNTFDLWLATLVKDPKTGTYSLKQDSLVQLTNVDGGIDGESRPVWVA